MRQPICLGFQIATPDVAFSEDLTSLYGDVEENVRYLKELGYDAVEFMTVDPIKLDQQEIAGILKKYGMRCAMVCTGEVFGTLHLSFTDPDPERRSLAIARIKELIDFAHVLDSNINIGRARGLIGEDVEADKKKSVEGLIEVSNYGAPLGVDVLLEPVERPATNYINTNAQGVELIRGIGLPNLRIMMDYSAMGHEGEAHLESARLFGGEDTEHVHLTEIDRWYPGYHGTEKFDAFIGELKNAGFQGSFVVEVLPWPDARTAAAKSFEALAPILMKHFQWKPM